MITRRHLERVKKNCIICNMGHSNLEIDLDCLKDLKKEKIRRNVTHITMPNGKTVVLLADVCVYLEISTIIIIWHYWARLVLPNFRRNTVSPSTVLSITQDINFVSVHN